MPKKPETIYDLVDSWEERCDRLRAINAKLLEALEVALPHLLRDEAQAEASMRSAATVLGKPYESTLHFAGRKARAAIKEARK